MKKILFLLCSVIIILSGCNNGKEANLPADTNGVTPENDTKEPETKFTGITSDTETPKIGNLYSNLNIFGYICDDNGTLFYRDGNNDGYLYKKDQDNNKTLLLEQKVLSINVIENSIYFISEDLDNKMCRTDMNGENLVVLSEAITYYMLVSEDSIFYTDETGKLYQLSLDGREVKLLSEDNCAWPNLYKDYIIYTCFGGTCNLIAVNITTGKTIEISEYGFSPVIYEDSLYFLDKSGNIQVMDLRTGDTIEYIEHWGQQFHPTEDGLYFSNTTDIFYYDRETKELQTLSIHGDSSEEISTMRIQVYLLHCDDTGIYYLYEIDTNFSLRFLNTETGEIEDFQ